MELSLENLQICNPPSKKIIKGIEYTVIAYRYDGYGIDVMIHIQNGKLCATLWQDNHKDAKPIHFDIKAHAIM